MLSEAHVHALHSGQIQSGFLLALAPLLPFCSLSPLPSFSFLSFSSSFLLSPFCFKKPSWGSARQESSHVDVMKCA
jgi:hypothetical protein